MTKVLSIRVPYKTIVQCYEIARKYGARSPQIRMGSAIVIALEALLSGLEKVGEIKSYTEDEVMQKMQEIYSVTMEPAIIAELPIPPVTLQPQVSPTPEVVPVPTVDRDRIQQAIEQELIEIERQEEIEMVQGISANSLFRKEVDTEEAVAPSAKAPWEGKQTVAVEDIPRNDRIFSAAIEMDELAALAVRVVYKQLHKSEWGSDKAVELVKATYKIFKEYKKGGN